MRMAKARSHFKESLNALLWSREGDCEEQHREKVVGGAGDPCCTEARVWNFDCTCLPVEWNDTIQSMFKSKGVYCSMLASGGACATILMNCSHQYAVWFVLKPVCREGASHRVQGIFEVEGDPSVGQEQDMRA